jgi:nitrile hydratase
MDTVHDLGGMQGFGPIEVNAPPFAHDWERRMWALAKNIPGPPGSTIDWWRHIVERLPPAAYLSMPYFEKWCLTHMTDQITGGVFTLDEVVAGHTARRQDPPAPTGLPGARARLRANEYFFDRPLDTPPLFAPGDPVRTLAHVTANHTRLPRYARDRRGEILAHRGAHVFADLSATGVEEPRHLYTVVFAATELWGDEADPRDTVTLDLWESYLGPA